MILHRVTLPWPDMVLSPNARGHWSIKAKAAAAAKTSTHWLAVSAGVRRLDLPRLTARFTFCPPSRRRFDLDNALARIKPHIDALASLTGVDDSLWSMRLERGDPCKDGAVIVELSDD